MVVRMKTTVIVSDPLMVQVKREAAKRGLTMSELIEAALRFFFAQQRRPQASPRPLPKFKSGGHLVNIDDREAVDNALEGGH